MEKPKVIEVYTDNGDLSHYTLIDVENGNKLWSEAPEECKAMGYAVATVDLTAESEDCLLQSAFILKNGKRIIVFSSCHTGLSSFECDENWKPYPKPFATLPPEMMETTYTDYHKNVRKLHGMEKLVIKHSSIL